MEVVINFLVQYSKTAILVISKSLRLSWSYEFIRKAVLITRRNEMEKKFDGLEYILYIKTP